MHKAFIGLKDSPTASSTTKTREGNRAVEIFSRLFVTSQNHLTCINAYSTPTKAELQSFCMGKFNFFRFLSWQISSKNLQLLSIFAFNKTTWVKKAWRTLGIQHKNIMSMKGKLAISIFNLVLATQQKYTVGIYTCLLHNSATSKIGNKPNIGALSWRSTDAMFPTN